MFVNTHLFSPAANYYVKHGRYDDGKFNSKEWDEYWTEETKRCLEGYSVGGIRITGCHYFYLNYCPIERISKKIFLGKEVEERKTGFPRFWDCDYEFFHIKEIARYGCDLKYYEDLKLSFKINPDDLGGGKHILLLKDRRVGGSYKGGAILAYNYIFVEGGSAFVVAGDTKYLQKDGILPKFLAVRDFQNRYLYDETYKVGQSGFFRNTLKSDHEKMMYKNGRLVGDGKTESGHLSTVIGITIGTDVDSVRGVAGQEIQFEEFGTCANAKVAWQIMRSSVQQGAKVFGQITGWGTGGTTGIDFQSMEEMFYEPETFGAISVRNAWDEGCYDTFVSLFHPATKNIEFTDKNGNSDIKAAKTFHDGERKVAEKSPDASVLLRYQAEHPYFPKEAMLNTDLNPFLSKELLLHIANIRESRQRKNGYTGLPIDIYLKDGKLEYQINYDKRPVDTFPINKDFIGKNKVDGCCIMYHPPYRRADGTIPPDLYITANDPYQHEESTDKTNMSLNATYIFENPNVFTDTKGGCIVAAYVGRPPAMDDCNKNVFNLSELYNSKIGGENNVGDVLGYARRFKKLHLLDKEFSLGFESSLMSKSVHRKFGMHMTDQRKKQGILYLKDWLYEIRSIDEEGNILLNLHTIKDLGLLEELEKFNDKGNFDRISACIVGMYHLKELDYQGRIARNRNNNNSEKIFSALTNFSTPPKNFFTINQQVRK